MGKTGFMITLLAILSGCATPMAQYMWVKDGATQGDFDRDMAKCQYEAAAATAGYGAGPTVRSSSGDFVQGFGEGMTRGLRQNELVQLCLTAHGYSKQPNHKPRPEMERGTSTSSQHPVPHADQSQSSSDSSISSQIAVGKIVRIQSEPMALYSEPLIESSRLERLDKNSSLKVIEVGLEWIRVESEHGTRGWIRRNWVGTVLWLQ